MVAKAKKNKREQKIKNRFFKILLSIFTLLILSALIYSNWKISQKRAEFQTKIKFLEEEIQRLEKEKEKYESEALEIDKQEYWEKYAKENLNLKKRGEKVVAFVLPEKGIESPTKEDSEIKSSFKGKLKKIIEEIIRFIKESWWD